LAFFFTTHYRPLAGLALALALCAQTACGAGSDSTAVATPTLRPPSATIAATTPPIPIFLVGDVARNDTAEITVHRLRRSRSEGGGSPPEGSIWLLLDISVSNLGPRALPLEASFTAVDGHEYERVQPPGIGTALASPVEPGADPRGEIAFLIEETTTYGTLIYGLGGLTWAIQLDRLLDR
jgi:hypothetical protein